MADRGPARTASADYYRKKAQGLLKKAQKRACLRRRLHYLVLADRWHRLAQSAEHPN